jgi:hypothetical protein
MILSMRLMLILFLALILGASIGIGHAKPKSKPKIDPAQKNAEFEQLFTNVFTAWDANHDSKLDVKELNAIIENPQIHGGDSAIAVYFHRHLIKADSDEAGTLTLADVTGMADDPKIQKNISSKAKHIETIDHTLFAPGDPNLLTVHQGGIGDCYLISVIGTFVFQHPQALRTMIAPQANGSYQIHFADGKQLIVTPMTDAELIMGAGENRDHGVWLSVLEKAYAVIDLEAKQKKTGKEIEAGDAVATDFIGHGGTCGPVIKLLTGHKTSSAALARWVKDDPQGGLEKAHTLLTKLAYEHKLISAGTGKDKEKVLPKGIAHSHAFGILGYNPATRMVIVFNPWGNHVKPAGPPGLVHGYPTEHGVFQVPLAEFVQIYGGITYETDKSVAAN